MSRSCSKRVSGDGLHFTGHFKVVVDQGCSVVCVKFDVKIFITALWILLLLYNRLAKFHAASYGSK